MAGPGWRWSLRVGEPFQPGGQCSWTAPVTDPAGTCLVLKVGYRFPGGDERDQAAGLRVWAGNGAVRLQAAAESELAYALLIERCLPGTPLGQALPEPEQDLVVAGLLRQLWASRTRPTRSGRSRRCARRGPRVRAGLRRRGARDRIDPGLARAGIALFRELPETADRRVLLCTDLHGDNILAAQRAPWLVIDPKPYVGDPAYDVLQHMLNCEDRLAADPAGLAARMAGLAGGRRPGPAVAVRPERPESVGSPSRRGLLRGLATTPPTSTVHGPRQRPRAVVAGPAHSGSLARPAPSDGTGLPGQAPVDPLQRRPDPHGAGASLVHDHCDRLSGAAQSLAHHCRLMVPRPAAQKMDAVDADTHLGVAQASQGVVGSRSRLSTSARRSWLAFLLAPRQQRIISRPLTLGALGFWAPTLAASRQEPP